MEIGKHLLKSVEQKQSLVYNCGMKARKDKLKYQLRIPPERIKKLVENIINGMPITYACDRALVNNNLLYRYVKDYEDYCKRLAEDDESADDSAIEIPVDENDEVIYEKLTTLTVGALVKNARAEALRELLDSLRCANREDVWQKYAWLIERSYRDTFGKEIELKATNTNDKAISQAITVSFVDPNSDEERLKQLDLETKEAIENVVG